MPPINPNRKPRTPRKEKMKAFKATFAQQRAEFPRMALPLIASIENGSMKAAVKLMCLDCSGWVRAEVRDCVIPRCPLFPFRPYQRKEGEPEDA